MRVLNTNFAVPIKRDVLGSSLKRHWASFYWHETEDHKTEWI